MTDQGKFYSSVSVVVNEHNLHVETYVEEIAERIGDMVITVAGFESGKDSSVAGYNAALEAIGVASFAELRNPLEFMRKNLNGGYGAPLTAITRGYTNVRLHSIGTGGLYGGILSAGRTI